MKIQEIMPKALGLYTHTHTHTHVSFKEEIQNFYKLT